ncbi:hypothetical protein C823_003038 [Eubacterium plexicaudatum ASF492]|nr:hypothetical protein C823_003038 [Eubacterium plexicaudatum ASF492]
MPDLPGECEKGKAVYLLSDMYYPGPYMEELLQEHGISGYAGLFVSCDLRKEKSDGSLYQWYLSYVGEGKKLHIGDNRRADVQRAAEYGIDTYHIYSAYELLAASAMQDILADTVSLQKRHILGLMVSKAFNDPFVLGHTGGRLHIRDARQVGFYFVGPLLTEFVVWLGQQMEKMKIRQMLFPSRDGYLVKKIYEIVMDGGVQTVYFRTSRRAASVAGIFDSSDIKRRGARKYNGTYGDWLKQRFGICMEDADPRGNTMMDSSDGEMMEQVLSDYEAAILQNAQEERERYLNYLDEKGILGGEKQAIFDFVAAGTVQHSLERILGRSLQGLYFATMNLPNDMYPEDTEHITAAYGNLTSYGSAASCGMQSGLGQHYLFLESVLVDGSESFSHIDCAGNLVFEKTDTQSGYDKVEKLQEAALEYAAEYRKYFTEPAAGGPEPELTDELFGMLFSGRCIVDRQVREIFKNDDIYDGIRTYRLWEE